MQVLRKRPLGVVVAVIISAVLGEVKITIQRRALPVDAVEITLMRSVSVGGETVRRAVGRGRAIRERGRSPPCHHVDLPGRGSVVEELV